MRLRAAKTRDITSRVNFPASCDEVTEEIGDVRLESPRGKEEEISEVIGRCGEREFTNADELHNSIVGNVSGEHVGRKRYDDRGPSLGDGNGPSF